MPRRRVCFAYHRALQIGLLTASTASVLCAVTREAHADTGSFSWTRSRGADGCRSRARIAEELSAALGRPVESALDGRALDVVIEHGTEGWAVSLFWRGTDGTPAGTRVIHDTQPTCDAVTHTAVTSIVIALGADAVDAPSSAPPSPEPVSSAPPIASPAPLPPLVVPHLTPPSTNFALGDITLGGQLTVGWLPVPAYGVQLVAEPLVFGRLRIAVVASALAEVSATFGMVQTGFAAEEFGADACFVVWHIASWVDSMLCAGARAGVVQAFVYAGLMSSGGAQGSFALEAMSMVRLTPVGPAVVEIGTIGRANVTQYSLRASAPGSTPIWTQSLGAFTVTIRLGVHF